MKRINNEEFYIIRQSEINFKGGSKAHPRSTCPVCSEKRAHPGDPSVSWNLETGVGYCHHCHARFKIDNNPDDFESRYGRYHKAEENVKVNFADHIIPMEPETLLYLKHRAISEDVAREAGISSRQTWRGTSWIHWVAFPFYRNGRLVNVQYKMADVQHKEFMFETGGEMVPWNIDCIFEDHGREPLYVTEGMMDALALMQCGYHYVISVPNGADSRLQTFDSFRSQIERKFEYLVFAGDTDEQGLKLCDRFCKYFKGKDVVCVTWKDDNAVTKDADDMLMNYGADAVRRCVGAAEMAGSEFVTMAGDDDKGIDNLFENGIPQGNIINLPGFDDLVHFQEGNLLLVTGYPGSGKSTLVNYIVMRLLSIYKWKTLFFSPEKLPQRYHEAELLSLLSGREFCKAQLSQSEFEHAKRALHGNVLFIREEVTELEQILAIARRSVRAYGIKVLVIDPFVYLTMPAIPGASETQKIAEMLKKLMIATRELNVFVILVAHPRKPSGEGPVEPTLYEVAGSANFYNFCDAGIIMERVKVGENLVKITCGKARRAFNGSLGECQIAYDAATGRYAPCVVNGGAYSTEHFAFDTSRWYKVPDIVPGALFGDNEVEQIVVDPGEQE